MTATSLYDWRCSRELVRSDTPFNALIMAALGRADSFNAAALRRTFPEICREAQERYDSPGGFLCNEAQRNQAEEEGSRGRITRQISDEPDDGMSMNRFNDDPIENREF